MTLFAVFVYAKTASFNDTKLYLNYGISSDFALSRGAITEGIFSLMNAVVGSELVVQIVVSIGCGFVIWYSIIPIINRIDMRLFWIAFLMPNFLLRSGYAGKEVIGIAGFFVLLRYMALLIDDRKPSFLLHLPLILLAFAVRPHYGLAYAWLLLACFILYGMRRGAVHSMFVHALPVVAAGAILFVFLFLSQYLSEVFQLTLSTAEQYFIASGRASSSRYWLHMNNFTDFIANMWWGLPASIIGPLPEEALARPIFVPLFVEGILSFVFIFYLIYRCLRAATKDETARRLILLGFIPAVAMALLIHYPFGVFNPGSGIRYKQNLAPLLYFFPVMFLAVVEPIKRLRRLARPPVLRGADGRPLRPPPAGGLSSIDAHAVSPSNGMERPPPRG